MRKVSIFIVFIGLFLVFGYLVSPDQDSLPLDRKGRLDLNHRTSSWTIMVYLNGDNALESAGIEDFLKMAAVGSSAQVNLVVQFDRSVGYDTRYDDWAGTKRFYVTHGMTPGRANAVMDLGETNMGNPMTLVDFVYWAKTNYPASNYALVLWNRSSGWYESKGELWQNRVRGEKGEHVFKALSRDDSMGGDYLYEAEFTRALAASGGAQLIALDVCQMGVVEAAVEIKDHGQAMIAFNGTQPTWSWPVDTILADLAANPSLTPLQLSQGLAARYDKSPGPGALLTVFDLTNMDSLIDRLQENYYTESQINHEYVGEGAAFGLQADDDYISYLLPFDFPFFGEIIPTNNFIYISSNGYVDFSPDSNHADYANSSAKLAANKRIAPCWADLKTNGSVQEGEDVYICESMDNLVIRWVAETYGDAEPVNFELVLYRDGRIQFNYNGGNEDISPWDTPPTIGISRGDSSNYYLSTYNGETTLTEVDSDLFTPTPAIIVVSPNGGVEWEAGLTKFIYWASIGAVGNVKIDYSTTNGESWRNIVESYDNTGSYEWEVPNDPSQNCLVRVSETDGEPADVSDEVFTILAPATITVTSPNGRETWTVGTTHAITWTSSGNLGDVRIEYSTTNGETWTNIAVCTTNDNSYQWRIPNTPSDNCRVRLSRCGFDGGASDMSDAVFTIAPTAAAVFVTSPNGGERFLVDSICEITWNTIGEIRSVKIDYSTTNGESWRTIVESTDNTGIYEWQIPDEPSGVCLVRVGAFGGEIWDISDAVFAIVPSPSITVTSPNGGENWLVNSSHNITWTSSGVVGYVRIEYSTDGGDSWAAVDLSTPNEGSYNWTIPNTPSNNCLLRITAFDIDGSPADMSDGVFSIVSQ